MSSAAKKIDYSQSEANEDFTANLEDGSAFNALYTELTASTTPGRGEVRIVTAYDRQSTFARTFTIIFEKDKLQGTAAITDKDIDASVSYNNYEDSQNPTLQKAITGTLVYNLDIDNKQFSGSFTADIVKADGSGTYACKAAFDTLLS